MKRCVSQEVTAQSRQCKNEQWLSQANLQDTSSFNQYLLYAILYQPFFSEMIQYLVVISCMEAHREKISQDFVTLQLLKKSSFFLTIKDPEVATQKTCKKGICW